MPARLRRFAAVPLALLAILAFLGAAPARTTAASSFTYDTYFWSSYERQVDNRTCVPASVAMMMNILNGRDLNLNQMAILRYAQSKDVLNDSVQRGTDPLGWATAASYYSHYTIRPTLYRWEAYGSKYEALKRAASRIAAYRKPVGLLVQHGKHAVVMTGFTASRNPNQGDFKLLSYFYSDPLGTRHASVGTSWSSFNTYLETDATPAYDKAWYGKYVIVVPTN
jgi:hypothetical protein